MRLIDADALKKLVKELRDDAPYSNVRWYVCNVILSMLGDENQTPTIEAEPVRHGRWVSDEVDVLFHCSVCETQISTSWDYDCDEMWNYCPNCGAKMDGDSHD